MSSPHPPVSALPSFGALIEDTWRLFLAHAPRLIPIAFMTGMVSLLALAIVNPDATLQSVRSGVAGWSTDPTGTTLTLPEQVASMVVGLVIDAATTLLILHTIAQRRTTVGHMLRHASARYVPFIVTEVLFIVIVLAGLILFIAPGIMFLFLFLLAPSLVFLENRSPISALRRSAELLRGNRLRLLLYSIVLYVFVGLALLLVSAVPYLGYFVEMVVVVPFLIIILYRIYLALTATSAVPPAP